MKLDCGVGASHVIIHYEKEYNRSDTRCQGISLLGIIRHFADAGFGGIPSGHPSSVEIFHVWGFSQSNRVIADPIQGEMSNQIFTKFTILLFCCSGTGVISMAQSTFQVVPLGVRGGLDESNLSCYAVAVTGRKEYICLDAGTVYTGIQRAINAGVWQGDATAFQKNNIKGYLISHPHLDHVSGMVLNAPDDSPKQIYATESSITALKENYFSWKSWANFTNEGEKPTLGKYTFVHLIPGTETSLQNTGMSVTPFVLSHGNPFESTAFLIRHNGFYLLYFGDTGADEIEKSDKLQQVWKTIGPLIESKKLTAIFIEVSYAGDQPKNLLFGHLTPQLLMNELNVLAKLSGNKNLQLVPIVVTHMKPSGDREKDIRKELESLNTMGWSLVFPAQGHALEF